MKRRNSTGCTPITEGQYKIILRDFLAINIAAGLACLGMFFVMLLEHFEIIPPLPCPVHEILHIYCPGCGGTRALFAVLQGEIWLSLCYNPIFLLGALIVIYYEIGVIVTLCKRNGKYYFYRKGTIVYLYLVFVLVFTMVRDFLLIVYRIDYLGDFVR